MRTRLVFSFLSIILLARTLVRSAPPVTPGKSAVVSPQTVRTNLLNAKLRRFKTLYTAGDFHAATALARQGYRDAMEALESKIAAQFLGNLGGCLFALHQYQEALQAYIKARQLAEAAGNNATAAALDFNISSLYSQLHQMDTATESARRAIQELSGDARAQQLPKALIQLANLYAYQDRMPDALALYRQGIGAADRAGDLDTQALGWNALGFEYLEHREFSKAESPLFEAYRIRKLNHFRTIESSYRNLGMLRLEQSDAPASSRLLDQAVELSGQPGGLRPAWEVYYARGRVRLKQNRLHDALDDLRIAARLARTWRRAAPPGDATRISTENYIQKVHSALVEAGNTLYFETHDPSLAQETFESAEANRAASLRALLAQPRDWRSRLPAEYWETLRKLESAEVELLRTRSGATFGAAGGVPPATDRSAVDRLQQLQAALIQWESQAGSDTDVELPGLLGHVQGDIAPDAALFAFHLASPNSYVWAVSRGRFALYRLPPSPLLVNLADRFSRAVRDGNNEAQPAGSQLFQALFGQIGAAFRGKPHWLLVLDSQLFELPFAALVVETHSTGPVFLAERHSLQVLSGAGMLAPPSSGFANASLGSFLGVADAVYNMADPRWTGSRRGSFAGFYLASASDSMAPAGLHLARLRGSAGEVAACAAEWRGPQAPVLLEGASACRQRLRSAIQGHPAVVHFAAHMIHSGQGDRPGLIVLSLTPSGQHEVVGPAEIATWNLEGALVSLSGCASGSAAALPGTGLMGLTRACQAAGAKAVVASHWPTPDDTGALFLSFYRSLRDGPRTEPAVALQRAQIDMLRSGSWRSNPRYWAAYFVTGNQQ